MGSCWVKLLIIRRGWLSWNRRSSHCLRRGNPWRRIGSSISLSKRSRLIFMVRLKSCMISRIGKLMRNLILIGLEIGYLGILRKFIRLRKVSKGWRLEKHLHRLLLISKNILKSCLSKLTNVQLQMWIWKRQVVRMKLGLEVKCLEWSQRQERLTCLERRLRMNLRRRIFKI